MKIPPPGTMEEGKMYCDICDRDIFPAYPWQGEGHIAVRLWGKGHPYRPPYYPFLNGEYVPAGWELMGGRRGWIIQWVNAFNEHQECDRCGPLGNLYRVMFGDVTVSLVDPNGDINSKGFVLT